MEYSYFGKILSRGIHCTFTAESIIVSTFLPVIRWTCIFFFAYFVKLLLRLCLKFETNLNDIARYFAHVSNLSPVVQWLLVVRCMVSRWRVWFHAVCLPEFLGIKHTGLSSLPTVFTVNPWSMWAVVFPALSMLATVVQSLRQALIL